MIARRSAWHITHWLAVVVLSCGFGLPARAASLYEQLQTGLEMRQKAEDALKGAAISDKTQRHLELLIGYQFVDAETFDGSLESAIKIAWSQLSAAEQNEISLWLAARAARNAADAAVAKLERAYYDAFVKKDQALNQAQADFKSEQQFLEQEKSALKTMPHDDAYLDRVSRLLERLKTAYTKMNAELGPYTGDFADARNFVADKEERLKKIAALEAEIARRRGQGGAGGIAGDDKGNATADSSANLPGPDGQPVPPPPGPLGDTYTLVGAPTITDGKGNPIAIPHGTIKKADASGIEIEVTDGDKKSTARIAISKAPPQSVRIYQRVDLSMTATGESPAFVTGQFYTDHVLGGVIPGGETSCSNLPTWRAQNPTVSNFSFYFGAKEPVQIKINAGRYNRENVWIVWTYQKSN